MVSKMTKCTDKTGIKSFHWLLWLLRHNFLLWRHKGITNYAMEPDNQQVKMINVTPHINSINMPSSEDHTFERHPSVFHDNTPPNKSPTGLPPRRSSTENKLAKMGQFRGFWWGVARICLLVENFCLIFVIMSF